jgi:NAD(P)-dependent dehydrogenase (short-subunit alcohol dehydrogenase family)
MGELAGKNMVVIGGSRGIGRCIAETGARLGARVLAVARHEAALRDLARNAPGIEVLAIDASRTGAPSKVFGAVIPDILVLSGGAIPVTAPLHEQSWREFAVNWECDVRIAFSFCKAALSRPLPAGSSVVLIASSAALGGSPLTGGYAGSKRTQMFIANYSQKESDRLGLGVRFVTLAPGIIPDSDFGRLTVNAYSSYLAMSANEFVRGMAAPPTSSDVAKAVVELSGNPCQSTGNMYIVTGKGFEAASICKW